MTRQPLVVYPFVLVVVRNDDAFLMIQEAGEDRGTWHVPAGSIEPGEGLFEAAIRETREEAGVDVKPVSLLWMDDLTYADSDGVWKGRWRFIVRAEALDPTQEPGPTEDALDARWFTLPEIRRLPLRDAEVVWVLERVADGHPEIALDSVYRYEG